MNHLESSLKSFVPILVRILTNMRTKLNLPNQFSIRVSISNKALLFEERTIHCLLGPRLVRPSRQITRKRTIFIYQLSPPPLFSESFNFYRSKKSPVYITTPSLGHKRFIVSPKSLPLFSLCALPAHRRRRQRFMPEPD